MRAIRDEDGVHTGLLPALVHEKHVVEDRGSDSHHASETETVDSSDGDECTQSVGIGSADVREDDKELTEEDDRPSAVHV
jgi:hypothetical protein